MCGRNSLYVNGKKLKNRYEASLDTNWNKSYNITPQDKLEEMMEETGYQPKEEVISD